MRGGKMRDEIERWLRDLGFNVPEIKFDGEFVRFGDKKSSWFVAREFSSNTDQGKVYYAATVGDWKLGEIHHFQNTIKLKPTEKKQIKTQQEIYQARIHREISEQHEKAARDSEIIFGTFKHGEHPYADKKGIKVMPDCRINEDYLAIPLRDVNGKFWSFQKIYPDSSKRFFAGGRTKNNFYQFGKIETKVFICEGYATGYTIHEKENEAVICAMSAGNIPNVARELKEKYPHLEFIYMADRDTHGKGEEMCKKAMEITGGEMRLPPEGFKDFNDARNTDLVPIVDDEIILGEFPDTTGGKNPKPLHTIKNLVELLKRLKVTIRYNVIAKKEEILIPNQNFTIDNQSNASLAWIVSMMKSVQMPTGNVQEFVNYIADQNIYNPVATWITSKPWDGKDRLTEMYGTVICADETNDGLLKETLMKRWFVSAVAGAFEPNGLSAHGMLVFQGAQAMGKTYWFKKLVPEHLKVRKDGLILKPDDRDSVKRAISYWLVELGELDGTFNKSDIAQLKSFMTSENDVMRLSYGRKESDFARRTVFFGSVNSDKFLVDNTGNRRFWSIECSSVNYKHQIDMQQFWAQIYELYKKGEPWVLQPEELEQLNKSNEKFEVIDPIEEMLQYCYDWQSEQRYWEWKSATKIASEIGKKDPKKSDVNSISRLTKKMNGGQAKHDGTKRVLLAPRLKV
jgi:putative DNA primase/helicase